MGLDTVELVMEIEETFGIRIEDEDAERIRTVGDVYRYILLCIADGRARFPKTPRDCVCLTAVSFYRIRRALMTVLGTARNRRVAAPCLAAQRIGKWSDQRTLQARKTTMRPHPAIVILFLLLLTHSIASADEPGGRNPLVRVVTLSQEAVDAAPGKPRLEATLVILDAAASFRPDIVCLPETFTRGEPETVPGLTTDRLARWAQEHSCYVICPISTRDGERRFNSAILLDRAGEVVGRYDKIRPTEGELDHGVCPGTPDPPIFETDFGAIGVQICFDVNWHDQWRRLKEKGAKIVFFPSAYPAARQLRSHAWIHQFFVVSATMTREASIYDITGEALETTGKYRRWAGAVLPVGKRLFEIDFHVKKMRQIEQKYGDRVQVAWYHDDDLVTLASLDPELTVDDLIEEFHLTPHSDYIQRAGKAQDACRPDAAAKPARNNE